ncbi:MAG: acetyltransferase [Microbacteriaceae bacterium]|nr:acetyltransferase [Microbacteriaceae bacterium]
MTTLAIIGASGLAREALALVREVGELTPVGVFDDSAAILGADFDGLPVLGTVDDSASSTADLLLVCIGSGASRHGIVGRLGQLGVPGDRYATVIDPSVRNPRGCPVGAGSILLANVVITAYVKIGQHVVVMPSCVLTHDTELASFATLASGVSLGGGVEIRTGSYIGMNASVFPRRSIGEYAVVGMGSVVLEDVPPGETWAGVPARLLRARTFEASR